MADSIYIIQETNSKLLVGIDAASGNYPFLTGDVQLAKIFNKREEAENYRKSMPRAAWYIDKNIDFVVVEYKRVDHD